MKDAIAVTHQSSPVVDPVRQTSARATEEEVPFDELLGASIEALAANLPREFAESLPGNSRIVPRDDRTEVLTASERTAEELLNSESVIAQLLVPGPPGTPPAPPGPPGATSAANIEESILPQHPPKKGPDVVQLAALQTAAAASLSAGRSETTAPARRDPGSDSAISPEAKNKEFPGVTEETKLSKENTSRSNFAPAPEFRPVETANRTVAAASLTHNEPDHRGSLVEALPGSSSVHSPHVSPPMHQITDFPVLHRLETIPQALGTPAWDEALANRVSWMATRDVQSAEIRLNPPELGPVNITLSLSGDSDSVANVHFSAAHPATREAIEAALPRLRDMLESSGISLGQTGVSAGGEEKQQTLRSQHAPAPHREQRETIFGITPVEKPERGNGMVDTFA